MTETIDPRPGKTGPLTLAEIEREETDPEKLEFILAVLRKCPGVTIHKKDGELVFHGIALKKEN